MFGDHVDNRKAIIIACRSKGSHEDCSGVHSSLSCRLLWSLNGEWMLVLGKLVCCSKTVAWFAKRAGRDIRTCLGGNVFSAQK